MIPTKEQITELRALEAEANRWHPSYPQMDGREANGEAGDRFGDAIVNAATGLLDAAEMLHALVTAYEEHCECTLDPESGRDTCPRCLALGEVLFRYHADETLAELKRDLRR